MLNAEYANGLCLLPDSQNHYHGIPDALLAKLAGGREARRRCRSR